MSECPEAARESPSQSDILLLIHRWVCLNARVGYGRDALQSKISTARELAANGRIDSLLSGKPQTLKRSYVFHSPVDDTVTEQSGRANTAFLAAFIGTSPKVDWGDPGDASDKAGHGIIAPDEGNQSCQLSGNETTYIRRCGAEDNAGKMFQALYDPGSALDASKRVNDIPESEVWEFDQQQLIEQVKVGGSTVSADHFWWGWASTSPRRKNFDLARKEYIYVPPSCRGTGSSCRVHIALHGCRQNAQHFAKKAGYNNWAEHYKVIVVYPAVEPVTPERSAACQLAPVSSVFDWSLIEPNPNGCWDWWGYLDTSSRTNRYLTKEGPQMQVIERIITEVTTP